jgi:GDSL-like Lipase/Acylhydrolase family
MTETRIDSFPRKTAFTMAVVILLASALPYLPGKKLAGVEPQQFVSMLSVRLGFPGIATAKVEPTKTAVAEARVPAKTAQGAAPFAKIEPFLTVPPGSLTTFFDALERVDQREPGAVVRVLHYGDSPTTQDFITSDVRALLQKRFGDGGHGFVLIAKPWEWYSHRGIGLDAHDWQIQPASIYQIRAKDGIHGLGGVSFVGQPGATSRVRLPDDQHTRATVYYLAQPDGGTFRVRSGERTLAEIDTAGDEKRPGFAEFALPPGTREVELTVASGTVRLFGYRFDKNGPGIQYSTLGINGARVQMIVAYFQISQWTEALRNERPDLVVLNYGTNESIYPSYIDTQYAGELRTVITRIRTAVPNASILIMSPMDRGVKDDDGVISTPEVLHRLIDVQRQIAAETGCAFFNTFEAMGGDGTMARWYASTPRLVSGDFMHPMPAGAAKVGTLFEQALINAYESRSSRLPEAKTPVSADKPTVEAKPSR